MLTLCLGFILAACSPVSATEPEPRMSLALSTFIARNSVAQDTAVIDARWVVPADGKGALDSITANMNDFNASGSLRLKLAATATAAQFRQPLPFQDSTYEGFVQVCVWRGNNLPACVDATVPVVYARPAPTAVTGLQVSATVIRAP